MRFPILLVALVAVVSVAAAAEPEVRLLAGDASRSVVEFRFPAEEAEPGVTQIAVAVDARPQWRVREVTWWQDPDGAVDPEALIERGGFAVMRGVGLYHLGVLEQLNGGRPASVIIEIDHPAGRQTANWLSQVDGEPAWLAEAATESAPPTMANPEQYPRLRVASRLASRTTAKAGRATVPDWFALSENWVRLEVEETGPYVLNGQSLRDMGVALAQIDPATLRLLRGGSWMLPEDPTVPDSLMSDRLGLTEVAITVEGGQDGSWELADRVLFYGFGTDTWRDRLDPAALPLETFEHIASDAGVYWLTWEPTGEPSSLPGTPLRIPTVTAGAHDGVAPLTQHWARLHREESYASVPHLLEDQFAWESSINASVTQPFFAEAAVANEPATFVVDVRCQRRGPITPTFQIRAWLNNDVAHADTLRQAVTAQRDSLRVRLRGQSTSLATGANLLHLNYDNFSVAGPGGGQQQYLALDSFDVMYRQHLDKARVVGALACNHWAHEVAAPGTPVNLQIAVPASEPVRVWDVSRPAAVRALSPTTTPTTATVGLLRDPDLAAQLLVIAEDDFLTVAAGAKVTVRPLRQEIGEVDYLVVTHPRFLTAAQSLADLRGRHLPGVANPVVAVVTTDDVYANFAGGQKDPLAIRNFLRWNFNARGQRLRYACLVGDASVDYRNHLGFDPETQLVDWIPAPQVNEFPRVPDGNSDVDPFASDDILASFDLPLIDDAPGDLTIFDAPDVALGRLIVTSAASAAAMVERIRVYTESPPDGAWRNRAVFCADDLHRPTYGDNLGYEVVHTNQAELLANQYVPAAIDLEKVYLINYPLVALYKPAARNALIERLNAGQTIFYYVGHGSAGNLADEQVLVSSDVAGLTNGDRRFLFLALSCDVGMYAETGRQCMAEDFVTSQDGGAIAAVAASWLSYISPNNALSNRLFAAMYPDRHTSATVTLGEALRAGKAALWQGGTYLTKRNSRRFALLGDPGLRLPHPIDDLTLSAASMDSLLTGRPHQVLIDLASQGLAVGNGATYDLRVEESALRRQIIGTNTWIESGNTAFRGTGPITTDPLSVPFLAPLQMRRGDLGRVRLIIDDDGEERAAVLAVPVVSAEASSDDNVGPDVALSFADGRRRVQAGTPLQAALHDTSGINVLGSNPANSLLLEFDDTGLYTDVTDRFTFAPGSYTRGRLDVPLPGDLAMGTHRVVLRASDMFDNVGTDTLSFELGAAGVVDIFDATVFPNPTPGPCRLVCETSDPMHLQWDIYTVSGRHIRSLRENADAAGAKILEWDGRDGEGDQIANGVYLYVLRGQSAADAGHQIRKTGQLVIMR